MTIRIDEYSGCLARAFLAPKSGGKESLFVYKRLLFVSFICQRKWKLLFFEGSLSLLLGQECCKSQETHGLHVVQVGEGLLSEPPCSCEWWSTVALLLTARRKWAVNDSSDISTLMMMPFIRSRFCLSPSSLFPSVQASSQRRGHARHWHTFTRCPTHGAPRSSRSSCLSLAFTTRRFLSKWSEEATLERARASWPEKLLTFWQIHWLQYFAGSRKPTGFVTT